MKNDGKFDAKFRVEQQIRLAICDEEDRLHDRSIFFGPDIGLQTINLGVYYVDGLNLDDKGCLQDTYYWSDDPNVGFIPGLDAADLRALQEGAWITLLEGSFDSNDPDKN